MSETKKPDKMRITNTTFITSHASAETYAAGLTEQNLPEICVVGRSNVGKSSFINMLTGQKIAKTSSQPGRTRLINLFNVNSGLFNLVDLPGYGYAEAGKAEKYSWQSLAEGYFNTSKTLKQAFMLVDCRHDSPLDKQMLGYLYYYQIPFTVLASKSDKLSKSALGKRIGEIASFFKIGRDNIIPVSHNGFGKENVLKRIEEVLFPSELIFEDIPQKESEEQSEN